MRLLYGEMRFRSGSLLPDVSALTCTMTYVNNLWCNFNATDALFCRSLMKNVAATFLSLLMTALRIWRFEKLEYV